MEFSGLEIGSFCFFERAILHQLKKANSLFLCCCMPDLSAKKGCGTDHLECNHKAHAGQPGDLAQSAWAYERQVLLN